MSNSKKQILYWASLVLYGFILFGVLLYLRFPADKFRRYCERLVESKLPEVACTIGEMSYVFPHELVIKEVQLVKAGTDEVYFLDPRLSLNPVWSNPSGAVLVKSEAFGGISTAIAQINREQRRIEILDAEMKDVDLQQVPFLSGKLDRKVSGILGIKGKAAISMDDFKISAADGTVTVLNGTLELKRPILELKELDLTDSSSDFLIQNNRVEFSSGIINNPMLKTEFEGNVDIAMPLSASIIKMQGAVTPQPPLYQKNRQLKVIVARMQKRYRNSSLPFKLGGNVGRPTFVFGK